MEEVFSPTCPACGAKIARETTSKCYNANFGTGSVSRQYACGFDMVVFQVDPYDPMMAIRINRHCPTAESGIAKLYGIDVPEGVRFEAGGDG